MNMSLLLALALGLFFGFALQRVGATNPQNIIDMLRLRNLHLMKAILLAIGVASLGLFVGLILGFIDPEHVSVKSSYVGVLVGGGLLGVGFAIGGYCPGTSLGGICEGRRDALFFTLGGLLGALVFMLAYGSIMDSVLFTEIFGGKTSLAVTGNDQFHGLLPRWGGLVLGAAFVVIACLLPNRLPPTKSATSLEEASGQEDPPPARG